MKCRLPCIVIAGVAAAAFLVRSRDPDIAITAAVAEKTNSGAAAAQPQTEVVIVGAGISGLTTALELGRGGADVTVIDMSSVFGGHAVMSQGGVSIVDSPVQREVSIQDSPDLAYGDFIRWGEDAQTEWVRYYVDHSRREIHDWLTELGVRFENVSTAPGNTVRRFHQPVDRGIGLVTPIYRACLEHENIRFRWNTQAMKLITTHGRVTGVEARTLRDGDRLRLQADALVLATGGFQSNLEMVREYWPRDVMFPERILVGSGRNSVGHGHRLAQAAGGHLSRMDHQWNYFTGIPDPRQPGSNRGLSAGNMHGIIVNPQGRRFASLHSWAKDVMPPMLAQKQATIWFIFDEAGKPKFTVSGTDWADFRKVERLILNNPDLVKKADTIAQLAELAGLPPRNLRQTIERYNLLVERGRDEDFHRFGPDRPEHNNEGSPKINSPPYYAMQAWPLTRKSMGGVVIDQGCRVLDKRNRPIPGLYAVGELTGLAGINGKAALEGTFLGPCIVTGRVAARSILGHPRPAAAESPSAPDRCVSCHNVTKLVNASRPGFRHFEQSHTIVLERKLHCLQCHAELAPYRKDRHRMNQHALPETCAQCHIARE